jgi:hypothetical protein
MNIMVRRRKIGKMYDVTLQRLTREYGRNPSRQQLNDRVTEVAKRNNFTVDRASRRNKEGLILWLCEHEDQQLMQSESPFDGSVDDEVDIERDNDDWGIPE